MINRKRIRSGCKKCGEVGKPKTPLSENARALPWRVTLLVRSSLLDIELKAVVYYIRASNPEVACMMASKLWAKWEKHDAGLGHLEYPDVESFGEAICIDNNDFLSAYKESLKYRARVAGDFKDPSAFTCLGRTDI